MIPEHRPQSRRFGSVRASCRTPVLSQSPPKTLVPGCECRPGASHSGGDKWRRVTMATCACSGPTPVSASRSHSPEGGLRDKPGEAAAENAAGRPDAGPRSGRLRAGAGKRGRRSGLGVGPPSGRPHVTPSVRQPVLLVSAAPCPPTARLSLWRTAVVKHHQSRAPATGRSQSLRFPEAPQDPAARGGQAGA